ncbi:MAG: hypothetical protein KKB34_08630 [Bacteroidetes bacterium]|nr:hypothetical protein [Bacteroidota bacterium]
MKRFILIFLLLNISLSAQTSGTLKWQKLIECLPQMKKVSDFNIRELVGDNNPNAYIFLTYSCYDDPDYGFGGKSIIIEVIDCIDSKAYMNIMLSLDPKEVMLGSDPNFAEPILIKEKFQGTKTVEVYDSVITKCRYAFKVADRFLIMLTSNEGDFFKEMDLLINDFNFVKLEKLN